MPSPNSLSPREITARVMAIGVQKTQLNVLSQWLLGMLAGAYIGFGALCYMLVKADSTLGFAVSHILSGLVFSTGLILVVVAGAELFTGNNLLTIAWAQKKISSFAVLKNWAIIITANFAGALLLAWLVYASDHASLNNGQVAAAYVRIANAKCALPFEVALLRGILCNILVCLAVWLACAGRSVTDKVLGIVFPITAFVAAGFEHSVANMYILSMGMLLQDSVATPSDALNAAGCLHNIAPVLLGNAIGGGVFVGLVYWAVYLRRKPPEHSA